VTLDHCHIGTVAQIHAWFLVLIQNQASLRLYRYQYDSAHDIRTLHRVDTAEDIYT